MEKSENFFNFGTDFFNVSNKKCEIEYIKVSKKRNPNDDFLKISPCEENIYYAFSGKNGLCTTTPAGSIKDENLLIKLISIPNSKIDKLINYFENYGFLLNIDTEIYVKIADIRKIIERINCLVDLINEVNKSEKDYNSILKKTLYLLLANSININTSDKEGYETYRNKCIKNILNDTLKINHSIPIININQKEYYLIEDKIYKEFNLNCDEYNDISTGEHFVFTYAGMEDKFYKALVVSYKNHTPSNNIQTYVLEFLFHFMHENGVIKNVINPTLIEFYDSGSFAMDKKMKNALLIVAKHTISQEINYNIQNIKAIYNPNTLEPSWKAKNLLSALYFSLFYMRPDSEILRKCANPSCSNYFKVKTSNSRKIYCCDKCRDAKNQRDHRKRKA